MQTLLFLFEIGCADNTHKVNDKKVFSNTLIKQHNYSLHMGLSKFG
jgi:hypothetical protein